MIIQGRGLGLRREFALSLANGPIRNDFDFLEVVPDNWMGLGGESMEQLDAIADKYPMVAHSLSLSIGDAQSLDMDYLRAVKTFLDNYDIAIYSDHVSMSRDSCGYLYELIPVRRTQASLQLMVDKIKAVQDYLSRRIALENISYYYDEEGQMAETEFIARLVDTSGCGLLLDVNNAYVNARNHGFDPRAFIDALPTDAVTYFHVAGHLDNGPQERVLDTHGTDVSAAVLNLGAYAVHRFGEQPIVLERDNNIPSLDELCEELRGIHQAMTGSTGKLQ
ncbi:DUF692 domain-containing protein [Pseudomonas sp. FW306-02-F02-AA]|uniref:DUF692 domain-containing protein n=1 Tax=Pseudomonas fluorescens TaxID=294 RepID=A0A0N7H0E3_PSEFL|nr:MULTISPECIES: DUF692 domain-containing protein [Pseudomonas]ALI02900.1 hypothetical protein AO353_18115 [Pseudomonas fluorescens]PMZ04334.1 DUF692 domain-containing protein [Pseudomonas sp. FW306-02-F02-AB]PMZ10583.1 DUF692 domain-containing protein [Pseudomonas sp. FW306-02-H06C]PMZ15977.1 DUF692 domain-containing protein [Pseudomonas sp. FW306-02-F02-AA]PMZ21905.1 DUF692 domain-containing protein [Pseudomonas sp. FW306-02-F08-AA]